MARKPSRQVMEQVAITGLGIVSSIGLSVKTYWDSLLQGMVAVGPAAADVMQQERHWWSAIGADFDPGAQLDVATLRSTDRFSQYLLFAAMEAVEQSGIGELPPLRTAVVIGCTMGGVPFLAETQAQFDQKGARAVPARLMSQVIPNMAASQIAMRWGLHGPLLTISTACASSLDAVGTAARMVERGEVDYAIAGGTENLLSPLVYQSLVHARAVSRAESAAMASRPFDRDRDGFVMGEGAGVVVLERETSARQAGRAVLGRVRGYGSVADGHHVTSPNPSGEWEALAMRLALEDARMSPNGTDVDAVFAHGTGTPVGDSAEIRAMNQVFGSRPEPLWATSVKGHIGHSMAASGVMALIGAVQGMLESKLPGTAGTQNLDPEIEFEVAVGKPKAMPMSAVQINAFGFGGQNASLVLAR